MASLWADGWFYISAGGFLVSCVLFVFLLGQYRAAVEAEDEDLVADGPALPSSPAEKIYIPKPVAEAPKPISVAPSPQPAPMPLKSVAAPEAPALKPLIVEAPAPKAAAPAPQPAKKAETTGPLSPALVYMQNLKEQMERLDKDIGSLKSLVGQQAAQNDTILKRLADLADKLETMPAASAAAPAPAPAETHLPATLELERAAPPAPTPAPAPKAEAMRSLEIEIASMTSPAPEPKSPEPAPQKAEPTPDADKTMVIEPTISPLKLTDNKDIPLPTRPGFETPAPAASEPAQPPQEKADKPADPAAESSPKPARKGPVWPI